MRTHNYLQGCLVSNVVQIIQFASALVQLLQEGLLRAEENWRWWILERLRHPFIHRVPHVTVNHLSQGRPTLRIGRCNAVLVVGGANLSLGVLPGITGVLGVLERTERINIYGLLEAALYQPFLFILRAVEISFDHVYLVEAFGFSGVAVPDSLVDTVTLVRDLECEARAGIFQRLWLPEDEFLFCVELILKIKTLAFFQNLLDAQVRRKAKLHLGLVHKHRVGRLQTSGGDGWPGGRRR